MYNMKANNPFPVTGYHGPEYFCDREREAAAMIDALQNGRNLTLISPRRMGKTGLIQHVFYQLKRQKPEITTLYMDIFPTQNLCEFVQFFASTVLEKLDSTPQKVMKKVGKFIRSFRPLFTVDEFTGMPKVTVDIAPAHEEASLKEIFACLQSSGKRYYIAIDEFQQMAEYPEKSVEALLRSYIQFLPNVNFIFAGSKQHVMHEMFLSAKRPFYQSTQIVTIDKIDRNEYYGFASGFFRGKRELDRETFSLIYDEFDGHTWYIQAILNRLYGNGKKPDTALVKKVIANIIAESTYTFENLLAAYSSVAVRVLKAIAKERRVKEINSGDFIARYSLKAASSVNTALKKLIDKELVYKTPGGYIVYDRFMAIWLRQQPY